MKALAARLLALFIAWSCATATFGQTNAAPSPDATAPPSAPAQPGQADLEKLVAPIALYPDPLLATLLPASAYPVEIVEAARFVKDTNNIAKLDSQPWDDNVKAVACQSRRLEPPRTAFRRSLHTRDGPGRMAISHPHCSPGRRLVL